MLCPTLNRRFGPQAEVADEERVGWARPACRLAVTRQTSSLVYHRHSSRTLRPVNCSLHAALSTGALERASPVDPIQVYNKEPLNLGGRRA
jgi:hypothetical protein